MKRKLAAASLFAFFHLFAVATLPVLLSACERDSDLENAAEDVGDGLEDSAEDVEDSLD